MLTPIVLILFIQGYPHAPIEVTQRFETEKNCRQVAWEIQKTTDLTVLYICAVRT